MVIVRIKGNNNIADVNSSNVCINTSTIGVDSEYDGYTGFMAVSTAIDDGSIISPATNRAIELDNDYKLRAGFDNILFSETFASTTLNTSIWTAVTTTMTVVITGGWCVLNSGASAAATTNARLQTWRSFPVFGTFSLVTEILAAIAYTPVSGNVLEWGVGICSAATAPTDGAFFRITQTGDLVCVLNTGGIEVTSKVLDFQTLIGVASCKRFKITIEEDSANYWINGVKVANLNAQVGAPSISSCNALPVFIRNYNVTLATEPQQIKVGRITVSQADNNMSKPWSHILAGTGAMSYQGTTGMPVGQTAQLTISANPSAAAPTATTAAMGSGLGGVFICNISGLAVTTDYIISSYQNTAASATMPGRTLYITGVKFMSANAGAANAASIMSWIVGLNFGGTNVNQSTAEGAAAKIARRMFLGAQTLAASAAIGIPATPEISLTFPYAPIVIESGEYIQTFLRFTNYTTTTSQALWVYVTFTGYWG